MIAIADPYGRPVVLIDDLGFRLPDRPDDSENWAGLNQFPES